MYNIKHFKVTGVVIWSNINQIELNSFIHDFKLLKIGNPVSHIIIIFYFKFEQVIVQCTQPYNHGEDCWLCSCPNEDHQHFPKEGETQILIAKKAGCLQHSLPKHIYGKLVRSPFRTLGSVTRRTEAGVTSSQAATYRRHQDRSDSCHIANVNS